MAFLATDEDGSEWVYDDRPTRSRVLNVWDSTGSANDLPKGSIEILIGRTLTWQDDPVELTETPDGAEEDG